MKSFIAYINESQAVDYTENFKKEDIDKIPLEAFFIEDDSDNKIEAYKGVKFQKFYYFGNCVNTVPSVWDATQMSNFVSTCSLYDINDVLGNIYGGDKALPKRFLKALEKIEDKNDLSQVVCACDERQRIMFIYISSLDIHFFFDCKK